MSLRLREIRCNRKLTQKQVADQIGCSPGAYSKYENGDREPSIDILNRLADFYGVSVDYLIGRDVLEHRALTTFEKELIQRLQGSPDCIQRSIVEILEILCHNYRQFKK